MRPQAPVELGRDFRDLLELFNKHQVKYLVAGGYATSIYAVPRYIKDIDIWLEASVENAKAVLVALAEFGFGSLGLEIGDFTKPDHVVQLGYEPNHVDLLTELKGLDFQAAFTRKNVVSLAGLDVLFVSPGDLAINKKAVGRHQNLADVEQILKRRPDLEA